DYILLPTRIDRRFIEEASDLTAKTAKKRASLFSFHLMAAGLAGSGLERLMIYDVHMNSPCFPGGLKGFPASVGSSVIIFPTDGAWSNCRRCILRKNCE